MIDAEAVMAAAEAETGLSDFGSGSFREGLDVYCESLRTEAQLSEIGTFALEANLTASLANRLRITDWLQRNPDGAAESIDAPIVVIGLFRAGTTLLSELLDLDPRTRSLLGWESSDSVPPPTPDTFRQGPRVEAGQAKAQMLDQLNPGLNAIHHEEANGPTECITLLAQDFKALLWESIANVPAYGRWLMQTDHRSAYAYHRGCLQVLQSGGVRGRWCLKSPHHAIALDGLVSAYPDARLVYIHRDPVVVATSACSLIRALSGTFTDADHGAYIARRWTEVLDESIGRVDKFRAAHPDHPILDVRYAELIGDPAGTLEGIYRFAGLDFTADTEKDVRSYLTSHPRGRFGAHRYDPAGVGLDEGELKDRFAAYTDRYQVEPERLDQP